MARGRMISKSLSISDKFAALDSLAGRAADFERVLFMLMVTHSEDHGRLPGDEGTIKRLVVPYTRKSLERIGDALRVLHESNLIVWYEVNGQKYVQIQKFHEHQDLHGHEGRASQYPDPPASGDDVPPQVPTSPLREGKRRELKGTKGKGREGALALRDCYHAACPMLPRVRDLTARRVVHAAARLSERPLEDWAAIFQRAAQSDFLTGQVPPSPGHSKPFLADFDWFISSPDNGTKVLEGKYDNREVNRKPAVGSPDYYTSWRQECAAMGHTPECPSPEWHELQCEKAKGA